MPQPPAAVAWSRHPPPQSRGQHRDTLLLYKALEYRGAPEAPRRQSCRRCPNGDFGSSDQRSNQSRAALALSTLGISDTLSRDGNREIVWGHRRLWPKCATWPSRHKPSGFRGIGHPACFLGNQSLLNLSPRAVIRSRDRRGENEEQVASSFVGSRRHLCVASPDKVSRRE